MPESTGSPSPSSGRAHDGVDARPRRRRGRHCATPPSGEAQIRPPSMPATAVPVRTRSAPRSVEQRRVQVAAVKADQRRAVALLDHIRVELRQRAFRRPAASAAARLRRCFDERRRGPATAARGHRSARSRGLPRAARSSRRPLEHRQLPARLPQRDPGAKAADPGSDDSSCASSSWSPPLEDISKAGRTDARPAFCIGSPYAPTGCASGGWVGPVLGGRLAPRPSAATRATSAGTSSSRRGASCSPAAGRRG